MMYLLGDGEMLVCEVFEEYVVGYEVWYCDDFLVGCGF